MHNFDGDLCVAVALMHYSCATNETESTTAHGGDVTTDGSAAGTTTPKSGAAEVNDNNTLTSLKRFINIYPAKQYILGNIGRAPRLTVSA